MQAENKSVVSKQICSIQKKTGKKPNDKKRATIYSPPCPTRRHGLLPQFSFSFSFFCESFWPSFLAISSNPSLLVVGVSLPESPPFLLDCKSSFSECSYTQFLLVVLYIETRSSTGFWACLIARVASETGRGGGFAGEALRPALGFFVPLLGPMVLVSSENGDIAKANPFGATNSHSYWLVHLNHCHCNWSPCYVHLHLSFLFLI